MGWMKATARIPSLAVAFIPCRYVQGRDDDFLYVHSNDSAPETISLPD